MAQTIYKETDGQSVDVSLIYTVSGERPILVDGMAGLPFEAGESGDTLAMRADGGVFQWQAPAGLALVKGDTVFVDISLTGAAHDVPDAGFVTASAADTIALFKVLEEKDANNWAIVKLINFTD